MKSQANDAAQPASGLLLFVPIFILAFANVCSFADRQLTSILAKPISESLDLSHTQMALLGGTAFALLYGVAGIPAGLAADRFVRRYLICGAILFWSFCTAMCGFASSFPVLFAARLGVGMGEAVLIPCAFSLIRDLIPANKRGLAFAIFGLGMPIGSALSLAIGGVLNTHLVANPATLGFLGDLFPWQKTFLIVSLVGIPAALFTLFLPEPKRAVHVAGSTTEKPIGSAAIAIFLVCVGLAGLMFMGMGFWTPSMFMERFNLSTGDVGIRLAIISICCASAGMFILGPVSDHFTRRFGLAGTSSVMCATLLLMIPCALLLAAGQPWNWVGAGLYFFTAVGFTPVASSIALHLGRAGRAGLMGAVYAFTVNIFGNGLGPLFYGSVKDWAASPMHDVIVYVTPAVAVGAALCALALTLMSSARARRTPEPTAAVLSAQES